MKKNKEFNWAKNILALGGALGGFLTMLISLNVPMVGPLNTLAVIAGAAGVIGLVIFGYSQFKK